MRVLLVEDEPELAGAIRDTLIAAGMLADVARSLEEAAAFASAYRFNVVILDRQLPDGDGLSLISTLRAGGTAVPVLMLTAMGDVADRVAGLDAGADDYMAKPFDVSELVARLHALSRRAAGLGEATIRVGRLDVDTQNHVVSVGDDVLDLTRREILVLAALVRRANRVIPRATLMDAVFGAEDDVLPNALDTQVSRLRRKLVDADAGVGIEAVRGLGFLLRSAR